jgi:hypothetical protein
MVINCYLSQVSSQNNGMMQFIEAYCSAKVCKLNVMLTRMNDALDIEKNHWNELRRLRKKNDAHFLWTCPINGMNMVELELFKKALGNLHKRVAQHAERVEIRGTFTQTLSFFVEMIHPLTRLLNMSQILNKI